MKVFKVDNMKSVVEKLIVRNKDMLFNIATGGLILNAIIVSSVFELNSLGDITAFITFWALSTMNKVTFKDKKFLNCQGHDLTDRLPTKFGQWLVIVLSLTFLALIMGAIPVGYNFCAAFLLAILSYFIFTNFPISILLNQEAWGRAAQVFGIKAIPKNLPDEFRLTEAESKSFNNYTRPSSSSISHHSSRSSSSTTSNPAYSSLPGNIYHNSR